ncbi:MAG: hypothetical protein H3C26_10015 [Rhodocyclaceae bacterium]|nr:hypothetical protein [Rhodocyclaceae bacterium]
MRPAGTDAMRQLQRITTEYVEAEDRIRLCGETESGETAVLWLTRRLLARLVPHLCDWLTQSAGDDARAALLNGFAQQAAAGALVPQPPVRAAAEGGKRVVRSIDVTVGGAAVQLAFRCDDGADAGLVLQATPLRQWLGILHAQCLKGEWPATDWPAWIAEGRLPVSAGGGAVVLH